MSKCNLHLWGSKRTLDPLTEVMLHQTAAERWRAIKHSVEGFEAWERAFIEDMQGNTEEAVKHHDHAIEVSANAREAWKNAIYRQSELISLLTSQPTNIGLREDFCEAVKDRSVREHVSELQENELLPIFINSEEDDIFQISTGILGKSAEEAPRTDYPDREDDEAWKEVVRLLELDLHQMQELKIAADRDNAATKEEKLNVENSKLAESAQHTIEIEGRFIASAQASTRLTSKLASYQAFVETYTTYLTKSLMDASTDHPEDQLKRYVVDTPTSRDQPPRYKGIDDQDSNEDQDSDDQDGDDQDGDDQDSGDSQDNDDE